MDRGSLSDIEVLATEIDIGSEAQGRARSAPQRLRVLRLSTRRRSNRDLDDGPGRDVDGDHAVVVGVGDDEAAVGEDVEPARLVDWLRKSEGAEMTRIPYPEEGVERVGDGDRTPGERRDAEWVLQLCTVAVAVVGAPFEQPVPDQRLDRAVAQDAQS